MYFCIFIKRYFYFSHFNSCVVVFDCGFSFSCINIHTMLGIFSCAYLPFGEVSALLCVFMGYLFSYRVLSVVSHILDIS